MIKIIHSKFNEYGGGERKIILLAQYILKQKIKLRIYANESNFNNSFPEINKDIIESFVVIRIPKLFWIIYINIILISSIFDGTKSIYISNHPAQLTALISIFLGLGNKITWICNEVQENLRQELKFSNKVSLFLNKIICKNIKRVIANSNSTSDKVLRYYKTKSDVIYPGVDINYIYNLIKNPEITTKLPFSYYMFIGRIEEGKNIELLLRLIKEYPKYKFIVVGSGSRLSYFKNQMINCLNVIWLGSTTDLEKFNLLNNANGLIFTSKDEPFGVVVIEALSLGCPVLAFDKGGPKEIILDNDMGILVETDQKFIESLSDLRRNPSSHNKLLEHIRNSYTVEVMNKKILANE
jgi:glycosyltransferase involved in cell wall biosynthesis